MPAFAELSRMMKELEEQLVTCMKCGMCQAVCPLYAETGREGDVARGKLVLLDGIMQEMFRDPASVSERLNRCLLCGSCAAGCPSGVSVLEIFAKARTILAGYMGLPPAKRILLRGMLAHPGLFDRMADWGARFQKIFTQPVNDILGTSCARFASPLIHHRHFKPLAAEPYHRQVPMLNTAPGKSGFKVAFFVGCLIDKFYPNVAQATVEVLRGKGVGIFMPASQGCCGIPAVSAGDSDAFRSLLRHNLACFEAQDFDFLVTSCATCTSTIKELWPVMAAGDDSLSQGVQRISEKTLDINQFLVRHVGIETPDHGPPDSPVRVTYHDPCHLKKALNVSSEPREVIRANASCELVEMEQPDWCCGMGGSFNVQYYELSGRIGRRKRDQVVATGCDVVATGCPACMMQISDMLSQSGDRIAVKHPIELLADGQLAKGNSS